MVNVLSIIRLMQDEKYRKANTENRVVMLKNEYEKIVEKEFHKNWERNWVKSEPFAYELVNMEFKLTKLLYTETTWGNSTPYNYQYINLEEIHHNPDFVKQLIVLLSLWEVGIPNVLIYEKIQDRNNIDAIRKSVKSFGEKHPEVKDLSKVIIANEKIRFFDVSRYYYETNGGGTNMNTETCIVEALIY